jgi:unsaturated chondroitin disaccharide hydrolase
MKAVKNEDIKHPEKYSGSPTITGAFCETAIQYILTKIDENLYTFTDKFPAPASHKNIYPAIANVDWTASFWTGMLWLAYEITGDEKYRQIAEIHLESFKKRINEEIAIHTHDLGFLYTLSCIAAYKLTNNEEAKHTALQAADHLRNRYVDQAGIIQAWGDLHDPAQRGRMIIDGLMNLPLLYWASQVTGNQQYYDIAYSHAQQTANYIVRANASTFHTFYMDVDTGAPKYGKTQQGYSDESCWARGQAWAIYGFPLSYWYNGDWAFIELAKKLTNYFLNRLPDDYVCYWDLIFTEGDEERDSSAAAIAACGMLELANHLPVTDDDKCLYAVYSKPLNVGVDECCIWGDYYYFEALVRLLKDWKVYW